MMKYLMTKKRLKHISYKISLIIIFALACLVHTDVFAKQIKASDINFATYPVNCLNQSGFNSSCYNSVDYKGYKFYFLIYPSISVTTGKTYNSYFSDYSKINGTASAVFSDSPFINIKIGDKRGLCMDGNKYFGPLTPIYKANSFYNSYTLPITYKKIMTYANSSDSNVVNAQLAMWFVTGGGGELSSSSSSWITYYKKISSALSNDADTSYFFESADFCSGINPEPANIYYAVKTRSECENVGVATTYANGICKSTNSGKVMMEYSTSEKKWTLKNRDFWIKIYPNIDKIVSNINDFVSEGSTTGMEGIKAFHDACKYINKDSNHVANYNSYFSKSSTATHEEDKGRENIAKSVASDINGSSETNYTIFVPYDNDYQRIITTTPDNTTFDISCDNLLGALKNKYNFYKTDINQLVNNQNYLNELKALGEYVGKTFNPRFPSCKENTCYKVSTIKSDPTMKKNPFYNPKIPGSSMYYLSWGFTNKTTVNTCECNMFEKDQSLISYYFGEDWTCEELKNTIAGIKSCDKAAKIFKCDGGGGGGKKTCSELLPSYPGYQNDAKFAEFKSRIEDSEKAIHNADGTISCNSCQPHVNVSSAVCKEKQTSFFELKDATVGDDGITPETVCYQNGTAYQIDGKERVLSYDATLGNSYCKVYCWESVVANMPGAPAEGEAKGGKVMWWGTGTQESGEFAYLEPTRICWTKPDYAAFSTAWYANEDEVAQAVATYNAKESYNNDTDDNHVKEGDSCCVGGSTHKEGKEEKCGMTASECQAYIGAENGCSYHGSKTGNAAYSDSSWCGGGGEKDVCDTDGHIYYKEEITSGEVKSASGKSFTGKSGVDKSDCTTSAPKATEFTVTNSKTEIENNIKDRQRLQNDINACQDTSRINKNTMYHLTAKISFTTEELTTLSKYGVKNTAVTLDVPRDGNGNPSVPDNAAVATDGVVAGADKVYSCTSTSYDGDYTNPCSGAAKSWSITNYSDFLWTYTSTFRFYYTQELLFYALKENMKLVNSNAIPLDYIKNKNLYYKAGYGYPQSFKKYSGNYSIQVTISDLGNNSHFDEILKQTDSKEKYGYDFQDGHKCPYYLYNAIYDQEKEKECKTPPCPSTCKTPPCPDGPSGLDVVYRLIDMGEGNINKVFPGKSGDGKTSRKIGANWYNFVYNGNEKFKNITTSSMIYDSTPMYTITLSPTTIGKIRDDNASYRSAKMDPYTSYRNPNNTIKIACTADEDENKTCVSSYITKLLTMGVIKSKNYGDVDEDKRLNALHKYKNCYTSGTKHC